MTLALTAVPALVAVGALVVAAVNDVIRYEIPDTLSIIILLAAAVFGILTPGFVWWSHGAAPVVMFAFGLLAFSRSWLGGGDVKLMTALAAWTGLAELPLMFCATSIAGGALTLLFAVRRRLAGRGTAAVTHVPYAVAIALGALWWVWATAGGPLAAR